MSKKKASAKTQAQQSAENTNEIETTALLDEQTSASALPPMERPAWIDGPPVTADGRVIRDGSFRNEKQMRLQADAGDENQTPDEGAEAGGKNWGDPYKAIFTCPEMGFELGENRRFRQRVFHFIEKPSEEILAELKDNKFIYRGAEKAWTIPASAETRKLTDDLARKWAGPGYAAGIER